MTSVTIPSSTGLPHGGYPSTREQISSSTTNFHSSRNSKRCRSLPSASESSKKRRKQSTPIRIYNSEPESGEVNSTYLENKPSESFENNDLRCNMCQLTFESDSQLDKHINCEHRSVKLKKEPEDELESTNNISEDAPLCLSLQRPDLQWADEMRNKDWIHNNVHGMPLNSGNPMFISMSQQNQSDNLPIKPIRIFNLDAYCGLCNKEFCNKYFLKTHKANKHGIYSDVSTAELMPPYSKGQSPEVTAKSELKTSVLNPYSIAFPCSFSNKPTKPSLAVYPENDLTDGQNRLSASTSNGPSSSSESDKVMQEEPTVDICQNNIPTEPTSAKNESEENLSFYDSLKMSPSQSNRELDLSNRYRKIGVMNPKAYCEMCNKEYCNKYFLRTHKMKRHGIYIADDKDQKLDGTMNQPWPFTVQTSPLNLIVTEQQSHERKTTSPNDISCEVCGIKFQNSSLAQLHNSTMHRKMSPKEPDNIDRLGEEQRSEDASKGTTENISEDLQKLQTMILQLNDIDAMKVATSCNFCSKGFENRFFLHAHMVTEHGMLVEDTPEFDKGLDSENSNNNTLCDFCGKDIPNAEDMKKHIMEIHTTVPEVKKEESNQEPSQPMSSKFVPSSSVPERRLSVNVTPTSSYCEICNKELCNKYFMKTHMQRMHGIEIENGAQIGGVVCDICNKELCSKYFLRVHKHNTHGIVEYGASILQPKKSEGEPPTLQPTTSTPEPDPALKPGDLADLSQRYFTHFTEVCPICSRRFRSSKWLKAHLISDHGQAGIEKWSELEQFQQLSQKQCKIVKSERNSPSLKNNSIQNVLSTVFGSEDSKTYQCSYCPFSSPLLPILFIHERTHSVNENNPFKCPICPQSFLERDLFQCHLYSHQSVLPLHPPLNGHNDTSKEQPRDSFEETPESNNEDSHAPNKAAPRFTLTELPSEVSQSLQNAAKKAQLPATYALPQSNSDYPHEDNSSEMPGYVMQAFLLEDSASDRRVVPSLVFLPMLQKQPAPLTVTFTLTPA